MKILVVMLLQVLWLDFNLASGCWPEVYHLDESSLKLENLYLRNTARLMVDGEAVKLKYRDGYKEVNFHHKKKVPDETRLSPKELSTLRDFFDKGEYEITSVERENVLFSIESDCHGIHYSKTGRITLKINIHGKKISLIYPSIGDVFAYERRPIDQLIPLFDR